MGSSTVPLSQHIEQKRFHVKVESFVLKEQLGHETQVLAVHLVLLSIHLKEGEALVSVDLVARGMMPRADTLHKDNTELGRGEMKCSGQWEESAAHTTPSGNRTQDTSI